MVVSAIREANTMKCPHCHKQIVNPISAAGGSASKRKISKAAQAKMQAARKKKRTVSTLRGDKE